MNNTLFESPLLRALNTWEALGNAGRAGRLVESQARKVIAEIYEQATGFWSKQLQTFAGETTPRFSCDCD